ncbi:MAG: hypothetical protein RLY31_2973 [Bacteroidota bacterium]|jgi:hypothetical protein
MKAKMLILSLGIWMPMLVLAPTSATGGTEPAPIVRVDQTGKTQLRVRMANLMRKHTRVSLSDADGRIWFDEVVWREQGYGKYLDFSGLPEGNYLLLVRGEPLFFARMVAWSERDGAVLFRTGPPLRGRGGIAMLTGISGTARGRLIARLAPYGTTAMGIRLANLEDEEVSLRLYAAGEQLAYEEHVRGQDGYAKALDFKGLVPGHYFLCLETPAVTIVQFVHWSGEAVTWGAQQHHPQTAVRRHGWVSR